MDETVARILDANFNRAREALRVIEDYARFVQDDPVGCELVKNLRHDLVGCMRRMSGEVLLLARNTPGDVGTTIFTASEQCRADARDVCTAATKRLCEALRTIEEYGKTVDPQFAGEVEAIRYRSYDLEQRVLMRGDRSARFAKTRLYVLVSDALCRGGRASRTPEEGGQDARPPERGWLETAEAAIRGGADCIQLREKGLEDGELLARARRLAGLCRRQGVLFIVNDRPDIARLADADGVHLGQADMPMHDARRILGADRLIGISTHDPRQLEDALAAGPDYIAVGPMFASSTKPQDLVPGPDLLAQAARRTEIPLVPIGGITPENAGILKEAGARRVCVCSAVISAADAESAARILVQAIDGQVVSS